MTTPAAPPAVSRDAMTDAVEADELLNVEMQQLARALALIAAPGLLRFERHEPPEPQAREPAGDGRAFERGQQEKCVEMTGNSAIPGLSAAIPGTRHVLSTRALLTVTS